MKTQADYDREEVELDAQIRQLAEQMTDDEARELTKKWADAVDAQFYDRDGKLYDFHRQTPAFPCRYRETRVFAAYARLNKCN